MILLAMYGRARSGKDTAADYLAQQLGLCKYAFAEPLKTMLKSVFGDHFHEGDRSGICPETGKSYREMMQTLGTEWGREMMSEDVWINLVQKKWDWVKDGCPVETNLGVMKNMEMWGKPVINGMILSDLRFDSEAEWVRSQGGFIIEIVRDSVLVIPSASSHVSEQGIHPEFVDLVINNVDTLDGLMDQLKNLAEVAKVPGYLQTLRGD